MKKQPAVEIRSAVADDAPAVARVHMTSRSKTMPYLPPQRRTHEQVSRWVRDVIIKECRTWVAVREGHVVGYTALAGDVLEHLYLLPDARRLGIGTMLLDEAKKCSPRGLTLHVFQQNSEARAFYDRHGFLVVATSDGSDNMEGLPELVLR